MQVGNFGKADVSGDVSSSRVSADVLEPVCAPFSGVAQKFQGRPRPKLGDLRSH